MVYISESHSLERLMNVAKAVNIYFEIARLKEKNPNEFFGPLLESFKDLFGVPFENVNAEMMEKAKEEIFSYMTTLTKDMVEDADEFQPQIPWDLHSDLSSLHDNFDVIASSDKFIHLYKPGHFYNTAKKNCEELCARINNEPENVFFDSVVEATKLINCLSSDAYRYISAAKESSKNNDNRDGLIKNLYAAFMAITAIDCILVARNTFDRKFKEFNESQQQLKEVFGDNDAAPIASVYPSSTPGSNELKTVYYVPEETIHVAFERMEKVLDGAEAFLLGNLDNTKHKFFMDYCFISEISGNEGFVDTIKSIANKAYEGLKSFFKTLKDFIFGVKKDSGEVITNAEKEINTSLAEINKAENVSVTEKVTASIANQLSNLDKDDLANMFRNAKSKADVVNAFKALLKDMASAQKDINAMESEVNSVSSSPNDVLALTNKAKDDMDKSAQSVFREEVKSTIETVKAKGRELSDKVRNVTRSIRVYITASQLAKKISTDSK